MAKIGSKKDLTVNSINGGNTYNYEDTPTLDDINNALHMIANNSEKSSGKQDTLINGVNIKTVNGESVLGEGNLEIKAGIQIQRVVSKFIETMWMSDLGVASIGRITYLSKNNDVIATRLDFFNDARVLNKIHIDRAIIGSTEMYVGKQKVDSDNFVIEDVNYYNARIVDIEGITYLEYDVFSDKDWTNENGRIKLNSLETTTRRLKLYNQINSWSSLNTRITKAANTETLDNSSIPNDCISMNKLTSDVRDKILEPKFSGNYEDLSNKPTFKTINGESIEGSGDISVSGGGSSGGSGKYLHKISGSLLYNRGKLEIEISNDNDIPILNSKEIANQRNNLVNFFYFRFSSDNRLVIQTEFTLSASYIDLSNGISFTNGIFSKYEDVIDYFDGRITDTIFKI